MKTIAKYWDLHIHGVMGIDFMKASHFEMMEACLFLEGQGIAAFTPTLLTDAPDLLEQALSRWGSFCVAWGKAKGRKGAIPLGIHLEGPFLSPQMSGAHNAQFLQKPSVPLFKKWLKLAHNQIAIVTLAPELPGAIPLIKFLTKKGIRVQLGHSMADEKATEAGIRAGAKGVTHLFNAMAFHHRNPGLLHGVISGKLQAEVITDGHHIHPSVVAWIANSFEGQVYAVSDGCSATCCPSRRIDELSLGSLEIAKQGNIAVVKSNNVLAGSATLITTHLAGLKKYSAKKHHKSLQEMFQPLNCALLKKRWKQKLKN